MNNNRLTIADILGPTFKGRGYKKRQLFFGNRKKTVEARDDRKKRTEIFRALEKKGQEFRESDLRNELRTIDNPHAILQYFINGATVAATAEYFETTKKRVYRLIVDSIKELHHPSKGS